VLAKEQQNALGHETAHLLRGKITFLLCYNFAMEPVFKKDNIQLRSFSENDAETLYRLIHANREHIGEWLSWVSNTTHADQIREKIREWAEKDEKGENKVFGIYYSDSLIGAVSFVSINKEDRNAEIGYWLDKAYTGKGIMTRACRLLISYGFTQLNLHRVALSCAAGNEKSCAIAKRLGFVKEGRLRESGLINGTFVDHEQYALLVHEWKPE
jgi:ribosomal-protein-serine acetyltransferase